jgi:hypothetical protein
MVKKTSDMQVHNILVKGDLRRGVEERTTFVYVCTSLKSTNTLETPWLHYLVRKIALKRTSSETISRSLRPEK